MASSFLQQLNAFLRRNYLLKRRRLKVTLQEFWFPIQFVLILAIIRLVISPKATPPLPNIPEHPLLQGQFMVSPSKHFLVSPNTSTVQQIMDAFISEMNFTGVPAYRLFSSESEVENAFSQNQAAVAGGIIFTDNILNNSMTYTLRVPFNSLPSSNSFFVGIDQCRKRGDGLDTSNCQANMYLTSHFSIIQMTLDTVLIRLQSNQTNFQKPDMSIQMLPKPSFQPYLSWFQILSAIYFIFAYTPFVNILTVYLVTEKEKKIKEAMKLMGMRDSAFWLSWSIIYFALILVVTLLIILIAWVARFFIHSNLFILFLMLYLYGLTLVNLAFLISPFFRKAQSAGAFAGFLTLLFSLLYLAVALTKQPNAEGIMESTLPVAAQWALSLLSPAALALALDKGLYLDIIGIGMNFDNINSGKFPISASLIMLSVDFFLYGLLAAYLDNVIPGEYGLRRPPYFFLLPSYWFPKETSSRLEEFQNLAELMHGNAEANSTDNDDIEPISQDLKGHDVVRLFNLKKVFKKGREEVAAVKGISLDLYEGQITCLLGHNGAGKTTLMNMLTGMSPPTSGSATVYGLDVTDHNDLTQLRSVTGFCPQHDILLEDLTCAEHLHLYANLKGVNPCKIEGEIKKVLGHVDLTEKADTVASELSGGQKRKLSVGIAIIGDPKIIFLDEPTAGMDPYSRRHLWTLLKNMRPGRVILLTTHFMDEADILADRKAFINKGKLQCVGSSLFLKNRFGVGYYLSMVVAEDSNISDITALVQRHIEEAEVKRFHGKELSYTLPLSSIHKFADLFGDLENPQAEIMGIKTFGVSMTSLEEVFLKLDDEKEEAEDENVLPQKSGPSANGQTDGAVINMEVTFSNGSDTCTVEQSDNHKVAQTSNSRWQQFKALTKIRWLQFFRSPVSVFFRIFYPLILVTIGTAMQKYLVTFNPSAVVDSSLTLNASRYVQLKSRLIGGYTRPALMYDSNPGGVNGSAFISVLNQSDLLLQPVNTSGDLLTLGPHFVGLKAKNVTSLNEVTYSTLTAMYNDTAVHSLPIAINVLMNGLLNLVSNPPEPLTIIRKTWPGTPPTQLNMAAFGAITLLGMPVAFLPAMLGAAVVEDREIKMKSQLRISGVTINMYWGHIFIVDFAQFFTVSAFSIIITLAFGARQLMYGGAIVALILLYLLYMPLTLFLNYIISFAFAKRETAFSVMPNLVTFLGFLPFLLVSMLDMLSTSNTGIILHYVFTILDPMYAIFGGLYFIQRLYSASATIQQTADPVIPFAEYFKWNNHILVALVMPLIQGILMYFGMRLLEVKTTGGDLGDVFGCGGSGGYKKQTNIKSENDDVIKNEDEDVAAERARVQQLNADAAASEGVVVAVSNLRKEFVKKNTGNLCQKGRDKTKLAVRNNTFAVKAGEVFGLLGPNGAGKSTTLNMIIAEEGPTAGKVTVAGYDVHSCLSEAFQHMGYCPQHDALWELITLREHLECIGLVRGMSPDNLNIIMNSFIKSLNLEEHADKRAKTLSGGTKRKLCYGMTMLADPKVVLLDEPSTGMDPKSKRYFWDTISANFNNDERGAILTTHYMEEADALCTRVAIMVNGQIDCLGSTQHLKQKYGSGYVLEVKLDSGGNLDDRMEGLDSAITALFGEAHKEECFAERITYNIPQDAVSSLSSTFASLEEAKAKYSVEEYSFSQSTLEQVFLRFAKKQLDENHSLDEERERRASHNRVSP